MKERLQALLSRKFLFALSVLISLSVLCWNGKIEAGIYSVGVVTLIGAFYTANVAQKKIVQTQEVK